MSTIEEVLDQRGVAVKRPWSFEEDEYLRTHYSITPTAESARHLGRTRHAVRSRARALGVSAKRARPWTDDEDRFLAEKAGEIGHRDMAEALGRSAEGVRIHAGRLGLVPKLGTPESRRLRSESLARRLELSHEDAAYLAGVLDGEGWISRVARDYWTVGVNNTSVDLIQKLARIAGGTVSGPYKPSPLGSRPMYRWSTSSSPRVLLLLQAVMSHLTVKRVEAEHAISDLQARGW